MEGLSLKESRKLVRLGPEEIERAGRDWDKCRFWLHKKQRFCKLDKISDAVPFCGEHVPTNSEISGGGDGRVRERVPCPIDPSHTCFKHLMESHVKKCNSKEPEIYPDYFKKDGNYFIEPVARANYILGGSEYAAAATGGKDNIPELDQNLGELSNEGFSQLIEKIVRVHGEQNLQPQEEFGIEPTVARELCKTHLGDSAAKHLAQIGSIIHLMENDKLLQDNTAFIEYGGGRGSITYHLVKTVVEKKLRNCRFYLIDKSSPRHKYDNRLTDLNVKVIRIRVDIKDLKVASLPGIDDKSVHRIVGVAKHLCGHATDMALFSLLDYPRDPSNPIVAGYCFASCCHQRCVFEAYTGTGFLQEHKFRRGDFNVLLQMSSWATCGHETDRLDEVKTVSESTLEYLKKIEIQNPSIFNKLTIGNFVKNILDHGRVEFSKRNGMPSRLIEFTDKIATPENRAIIGSTGKISPAPAELLSIDDANE